ncbi:tRNA lysidine(34) synthetase TilS [secondary endosymbiont of Trabutina mannipara]|uniref:tRNA lysidine(34) synthetase TilS n=1 Tax=secondary endosymbiont of Trabutina mannipara TaxID=1835721 RepID=UPI001E3CEF92|nr:tRNA lysidine(34) synthetase TilS [secondary endosymbiont of Trabutina mannipara]
MVRSPNITEKVSVRFGSVHGLLYINGRRRGRKLKKILQELAIPPWQRGYIPLLFYNEKLIAAIGTFVTLEGTAHKFCSKWYLFRKS